MLYAHFPDASCFKKIFDTIKHYGQLVFHFTRNGLCFQGLDKSKVSLLNVDLPAQMFDCYLCDDEIIAGIDVPQFYQIIKLAYKDGGVTISDSDDPHQFKIEFVSEAGVQRIVDIQQLVLEEEFTEIPVVTYDCIATIPCGEFLQIIQEASLYFDSILISNKHSGAIEIVGKDTASTIKTVSTKIAATHSVDEKKKITVENYNHFERCYNLRLVKSITKAANMSAAVTLKFCSNTVLLVEFKILGHGVMQFFLPEKIQEDKQLEKDAKEGIHQTTTNDNNND